MCWLNNNMICTLTFICIVLILICLQLQLELLRWVVEPGVHVLGEEPVAALNACDLSSGAGLTQSRLGF